MSLTSQPADDLIPEELLRAALRPLQGDAAAFNAGVLERIERLEAERTADPLAHSSSFLRAAAAILPAPILGGGKGAAVAAVGKTSLLSQVLGFVALPAVSLFVMLGAGVFSAARIKRMQQDNVLADLDSLAMDAVAKDWWHQNRWLALLYLALTIGLPFLGFTWLLLLLYLISLGVLLWILQGFAACGVGSRRLIGGTFVGGLGLLGQVSAFCTTGQQEIHLVDQLLLPVVLFSGALIVGFLSRASDLGPRFLDRRQHWWSWIFSLPMLQLLVSVPVIAWFTSAQWAPLTPKRMQAHVENFEKAPYKSVSWNQWEIEARWVVDSGSQPNFSRPKKLFKETDWGNLAPFVSGVALRMDLVPASQVNDLPGATGYRQSLKNLLEPREVLATRPIQSLAQQEWIIRAAQLRNDLSAADRDFLAMRLHVNLDVLWAEPYRKLEEALRVTQLLDTIGRPLDRDQYRPQIHKLLREFHVLNAGIFQDSGGFRSFASGNYCNLEATAHAVELMQIFGVPNGLDLDWVRSYLRPRVMLLGEQAFMTAAVRERLNHLPGIRQPTWLTYLYYEPSLVMAVLLVGMCVYATLTSPVDKRVASICGGSADARILVQ